MKFFLCQNLFFFFSDILRKVNNRNNIFHLMDEKTRKTRFGMFPNIGKGLPELQNTQAKTTKNQGKNQE